MPNFNDLMKSAASGIANNKFGGMAGGAGGMQQGPGGVRIRKGQTLGGAIAGVFIGIAMVIASPAVLWQAESQHTAKDFQKAESVEADAGTDGYVTFQAAPSVAAPLSCAEGSQCLYYKVQNQELKTVQEEQCGNVSKDARIISKTVMECDEDGANCKQCYQVERDVWTTITEDAKYTEAKVGAYTVEFNEHALMLGLEEKTIEKTPTTRDVWTFFPIPEELRVAGDASNSKVSSAQTTYVLSPYDQGRTLTELQNRDTANKWIFRIVTFLMLFIGFGSIFGPLSYFAHLMRKIPIVGPFIKEGAGLVIGLVSLVLAVVSFVVMWLVISVVKSLVLVVLLFVLVIGGVVFMVMKKKD